MDAQTPDTATADESIPVDRRITIAEGQTLPDLTLAELRREIASIKSPGKKRKIAQARAAGVKNVRDGEMSWTDYRLIFELVKHA